MVQSSRPFPPGHAPAYFFWMNRAGKAGAAGWQVRGVLDLDVWHAGAKAVMVSKDIKMPYTDLSL